MPDKKSLKVGDKIVEIGHVYRIFKIRDKNGNGDKTKTIFFKPYYKNKNNKTVVSSIPAKNIKKANIRRPLKKTKLKNLLSELVKKKPEEFEPLKLDKAKDALNLNSPRETIKVIRNIWIERKEKDNQLTKSKRDVYELALNRLVEEIALVDRISLKKAREKIKSYLKRIPA